MTVDSFENIDQFLESLGEETVPSNDQKTYDKPLYKKWFKSKTQSGFLTITPWVEALKLKIDIGKTSSEGKLISSTNVFVDYIDFGAYLKSIVMGVGASNYPANDRMGVPSPEGFVSYGGGTVNSKPISRILKCHYWKTGEEWDSSSFVWKTGHFEARKSDSGAFIPNMSSPISVDSIKVTRQEICSISYMLDLFGSRMPMEVFHD
jgi:hypothetical protein